jgi:hypothetical protein
MHGKHGIQFKAAENGSEPPPDIPPFYSCYLRRKAAFNDTRASQDGSLPRLLQCPATQLRRQKRRLKT